MKVLKVAVSDGFDNNYLNLLGKLGTIEVVSFKELKDKVKDKTVDLLVFTGGEDVNPVYYNEPQGKNTYINPDRDKLEAEIFERYYGTPKLGICRGSQFLTVMSGGKLIQHVENHTSPHIMTFDIDRRRDTLKFKITSTHHQMMYPFNLPSRDFNLIGWSSKFLSDVYLDGNNKQKEIKSNFLEPEIVHYPKTNVLAIQGHPEFPSASEDFKGLTINLIKKYLLNN